MGTAAGWIALSGHRRPFPHGPSGGSLVLTKQLAYYRDHQIRRRRLTDAARLSLVLWSRLFEEALMVVTPGTFVRWHRKGFKRYWRWKSGGGRPALPKDIRQLIARMVRENLTWGEERVADELSFKLGILVSPRTVRKYWPRQPDGIWQRRTSSQHWRTFVKKRSTGPSGARGLKEKDR